MKRGHRFTITLDAGSALKLARLAERMDVEEAVTARLLLAKALDDADPDAGQIVALLDGIPGAYERARVGIEQARTGDKIALDEL